mgnify:CR=1 FL=1
MQNLTIINANGCINNVIRKHEEVSLGTRIRVKNIPQVILAPLTGKAVPLSEVPDSVFSEKVLGDGVAIIPADGKIVSPVDGEISTVAETRYLL